MTTPVPHQFLRSCGNLNNDFALSTCVAKFVPPLTGLSLVAHWALQARPSGKFGLLIKGHQNVLAHFVLIATTVSVGLVAAAPNLIYLFNTGSRGPKKGGRRVDRVNEGVQTYYNILKSSWGRRDSAASASEKKFLLYGAGTGISSIFVLLATLFALTSMLIAGKFKSGHNYTTKKLSEKKDSLQRLYFQFPNVTQFQLSFCHLFVL